jgi:hypothetical protein
VVRLAVVQVHDRSDEAGAGGPHQSRGLPLVFLDAAGGGSARVRAQQVADLRAIQREVNDRFKVQIEAYYARLEDGGAAFERVTP